MKQTDPESCFASEEEEEEEEDIGLSSSSL